MDSEAAMFCASAPLLLGAVDTWETGVWVPGVVVVDLAGASGGIVDCEEEREKVLARGARCVSFSSVYRCQLTRLLTLRISYAW